MRVPLEPYHKSGVNVAVVGASHAGIMPDERSIPSDEEAKIPRTTDLVPE
jgi:hypothetical protein